MVAERTVVLGGGLAGLSAGCMLSREGEEATIVESSHGIGGLARTKKWQDCLFDLGGHRFHTTNAELLAFVKDLMGKELIHVPRSSKICLRGRYFDYPLRPLNALAALGPREALAILFDYVWEKMKSPWQSRPPRSLRDKVVRDFGERLFKIFFRDYSEKVWGLSCDSISADWIAKRIQGLSLGGAIRNALLGKSGPFPATLDDSFYYPARGIGRISDRLCEETLKCGSVMTDTSVTGVHHNGSAIHGLTLRGGRGEEFMPVDAVLSTIPLPGLIRMLHPQPPTDVLRTLSGLRYRDLLVVALLVDRPQVTDQTWVYFPERKVPFGRLHEPKNWSADMAPPERTVVVTEYFCFAGDKTWTTSDDDLSEQTAAALEDLGFLRPGEVLDAKILRVPKAYPLFDTEYLERLDVARTYLKGFTNLYCAGRTGTFGYLNMDEALESGMRAAGTLLNDRRAGRFAGATVERVGTTAVTVP